MSFVPDVPPGQPRGLDARSETSRKNAQLSTGPKSPAGKSRARFNAQKHSLSGDSCMLHEDNVEAYNKLGASLIQLWQPSEEEEFRMVSVLHDTQWRLARIPILQMDFEMKGFIEHYENYAEYEEPMRRSLARAAAYEAKANLFDQISRHETRLYRINARTEQALMQAINARRVQQDQAEDEQATQEHSLAETQVQALIRNVDHLVKEERARTGAPVKPGYKIVRPPFGSFDLHVPMTTPEQAPNATAQEGGNR